MFFKIYFGFVAKTAAVVARIFIYSSDSSAARNLIKLHCKFRLKIITFVEEIIHKSHGYQV